METRRTTYLVALLASISLAFVGCGDDGGGGDKGGGSDNGGGGSDATSDTGTPDNDTTTPPDDDTGMQTDTGTEDTGGGGNDGGGGGDTTTFKIRIENKAASDFYAQPTPATQGQVWVTPGAYAVHTGDNPVYTTGEQASSGLESVAETGKPGGTPASAHSSLVDELSNASNTLKAGAWSPDDTVEDPNDPMDPGNPPGAPPIAPGGAFEFDVEVPVSETSARMSFATMYVPSNDIFISTDSDGIPLFQNGNNPIGSTDVSDQIVLLDAGTEANEQPGFGPNSAPIQSNPDDGSDEGSNVRSLGNVDDGYNYPASGADAVNVTIDSSGVSGGTVTFTVRIENATPADGFYPQSPTPPGGAIWLTPGGYTIHSGDSNPIYKTGESASAALESIAEAGKPGGTSSSNHEAFESALAGQSNVKEATAWGPDATVEDPNDPMKPDVPGAPPIAKDGAYEFTVQAEMGDRIAFATMFVPSNDLFLGPRGKGIALFDDGNPISGEVTSKIRLYDAGTEFNQKPGFALQGAPLQKNNGGPDAGRDEGGNVRSISNVTDGYNYPDVSDTISVTVTPNPGSSN